MTREHGFQFTDPAGETGHLTEKGKRRRKPGGKAPRLEQEIRHYNRRQQRANEVLPVSTPVEKPQTRRYEQTLPWYLEKD